MKITHKFITSIAFLILLTAGFLLANFRLMKSQTQVNSTTVSSTGSPPDTKPTRPERTAVIVSGDARLVRAMQVKILRELQAVPDIGLLHQISESDTTTGGALIWVELKSFQNVWTPVYARTTLDVTLSYASNGDVSFRLTEPVAFKQTGEQPAVLLKGHYEIVDSSWGVISYPGYLDFLSAKTSEQLAAELQKLYQ